MEEEMNFETLFEVLMREKNREELQRIDNDFYEKARKLISKENKNLFFSSGNHTAIQKLKNLQNMLLEIYSRRERKILYLASLKAKTNADVFDVSVMLEEEKRMFNGIVSILKAQRKSLISRDENNSEQKKEQGGEQKKDESKTVANETPNEKHQNSAQNMQKHHDYKSESAGQSIGQYQKAVYESPEYDVPSSEKPEISEMPEAPGESPGFDSQKLMPVKFLRPVSRFIGEELETYGPYDKNDTAMLPKNIAEILISKGDAALQN